MPKKKSKNEPPADKQGPPASTPETLTIPGWYTVKSIEQLKSIANPMRIRILGHLAEQPMTTKQVAQAMGEAPTKLYHHVDALASASLIELVKEVPKRGTVEKFYRAVAKRFRADEEVFGTVPTDDRTGVVMEAIDTSRREIRELASEPDDDQEGRFVAAAWAVVKVTDAQIESIAMELATSLESTLEDKERQADDDQVRTAYRVSLLIHPVKDTDEPNRT